ncbi:Ankyrin repeat-containing protein ITN1 [Vitis vinifera]|uniref:Ankyrin repeat-containing protein ITN1 n=1 Tax=Vitis vinifera TaxID=29760 RepID=A0A438BNC7_VITVI|nr:Ankyrin repeat-containing protein ITN1 [Vitis vinifera]
MGNNYWNGITTKLLEWKPSLTKEVNENGWSPLQCAAHFGYTTIVKQLLDKSPDKPVACLGIKRGKKTALLIAAKRGHKDIVDLLLSYSPDCCEQVDDNGKNVLHFAMMNKQDYYPGMFLQNDGLRVRGLLNERDAQGDTPLHLLASYLVYDEEFVLDDRVDKMGLNNNNLTTKDIKFVLNHFSKSKEVGIGPLSWVPGDKKDNDSSESKDSKDNSISKLKRTGETHLIVAALVATVTFEAGFTFPGGYNENDGKAILAKKAAFKAFVVTDTLAMVFSGVFLTMFGMGSMVVAFMTGIYAVLPHFSSFRSLFESSAAAFSSSSIIYLNNFKNAEGLDA